MALGFGLLQCFTQLPSQKKWSKQASLILKVLFNVNTTRTTLFFPYQPSPYLIWQVVSGPDTQWLVFQQSYSRTRVPVYLFFCYHIQPKALSEAFWAVALQGEIWMGIKGSGMYFPPSIAAWMNSTKGWSCAYSQHPGGGSWVKAQPNGLRETRTVLIYMAWKPDPPKYPFDHSKTLINFKLLIGPYGVQVFMAKLQGNLTWVSYTYKVSPGSHVLEWRSPSQDMENPQFCTRGLPNKKLHIYIYILVCIFGMTTALRQVSESM